MKNNTSLPPPLPPRRMTQRPESFAAGFFWQQAPHDLLQERASMFLFWKHFNEACEMTPDGDDPLQRGLVACHIVAGADNDMLRALSPEIHLELLKEMDGVPEENPVRRTSATRVLATVSATPAHKAWREEGVSKACERISATMDLFSLRREWPALDRTDRLRTLRHAAACYMEGFGVRKVPRIAAARFPRAKDGSILLGDADGRGKIRINTHPESVWEDFPSVLHTLLHESHHVLCQRMADGLLEAPCKTTQALLLWNDGAYVDVAPSDVPAQARHGETLPVGGNDAYYNAQLLEREANEAADRMMERLRLDGAAPSQKRLPGCDFQPRFH